MTGSEPQVSLYTSDERTTVTTVRRALALSFIERYLSIMLGLASNMALARLLTPQEIGTYSVALAVIGIAQVLRDFGVGNFLIQQKELHDDHVRTAFGVSLAIGVVLGTTIFFAAPWVASFYNSNAMINLLRIVSLNFFVLPFCSISLSLLRRDMRFKALLYASLAAMAVGTAVTLSLAWNGCGAVSLAVGSVAGNFATGFFTWWARGRPTLIRPGFREWRAVLNFGGQSALSGVVTSAAMDINDLVVGKVIGFAPVAVLSRAQGLMNIFHRDIMGAIRNVAYPAFASLHREGRAVEEKHIAAISMVTVCAWPFYGFIALFSREVMRVLFGSQWDEAAALAPIYAAAGSFSAISSLSMSALMAIQRIDLVTRTEMLFQPARAAVIVYTAVEFKSILACAIAYLFAFALHPVIAFWIKQSAMPTDFNRLARELGRSALASFITLLPAILISSYIGFDRTSTASASLFALAVIATIAMWPASLLLTDHAVSRDPLFVKLTRHLPTLR